MPQTTNKNLVLGLTAVGAIIILVISYIYFKDISTFFSKEKKVKVVVSFPIGVSTAKSAMDSVRLAFKEMEYKAGDYAIELIEYDDGDASGAWLSEKATEIANRAAADKDVVAFIGPLNSGASKIITPILNKAGIVHINPTNTWPGLTKSGFADGEPDKYYPTGVKNYFRVVTTDDIQGEAAALWAKKLGLKTVLAIDDGGTYGKGIALLFTKKYKELGFEIKGEETLSDTKATEFKDLVQKIVTKNPDFVYFGGDLSSGITYIIPQARAAGYKGLFMGPDALLGQDFIVRTGKEYAEGVYITSVGIPAKNIDSREAEAFHTNYSKEYGTEPEVFGATAYESAKIIIKAIERGGPNRTKVLESVRSLDNYISMFGPISFDDAGDVKQKHVSASVVKDGEFLFLYPLNID
jgi:branched-chain amino acid transport system substrate-binding protein